jgi:hypothetical protein
MKNEFIPYEEALALKELGFNEELCYGFYDEMDNFTNKHLDGLGKNMEYGSHLNMMIVTVLKLIYVGMLVNVLNMESVLYFLQMN